jgi:hypothetical protein
MAGLVQLYICQGLHEDERSLEMGVKVIREAREPV